MRYIVITIGENGLNVAAQYEEREEAMHSVECMRRCNATVTRSVQFGENLIYMVYLRRE